MKEVKEDNTIGIISFSVPEKRSIEFLLLQHKRDDLFSFDFSQLIDIRILLAAGDKRMYLT